MKNIQIRGESKIGFSQPLKIFSIQEGVYSLVSTSDFGVNIHTSIDFSTHNIDVHCEDYPVSEGLVGEIERYKAHEEEYRQRSQKEEWIDFGDLFRELSEEVKDEIHQIRERTYEPAKKILSCIKYFHSNYGLSERLILGNALEWKIDENDWDRVPGPTSAHREMGSITPWNRMFPMVQSTTSAGIEPLLGLSFLHKAKSESGPSYRWISATIAAELCIKEILVRKKPTVEIILLECPSPQLTKLYGSIMEHYLGERSPYLKILDEGAKKRNSLIHKPALISISENEARDYVTNIEKVIFHALSLLYPDDPSVKWQYYKLSLGDKP